MITQSVFAGRYYDSAIGRWLSVDPKASKYPGWSPYNYCLNNPLRFVDPNGQAPGDLFINKKSAALDWAKLYNAKSIEMKKEMGSVMKPVEKDGTVFYTYGEPEVGTKDRLTYKGTDDAVGIIHSHGAFEEGMTNNTFSDIDISLCDDHKLIGFLSTPNGSLLEYDPAPQSVPTLIATGLADDPNDPSAPDHVFPSIELPKSEVKPLELEPVQVPQL